MSNKSNFIAQIKQEEERSALMLIKTEEENNARVVSATEESIKLVGQAEEKAREVGRDKLMKAKEVAKTEYDNIISSGDSVCRNVVSRGKENLSKAQRYIKDEFVSMFN